MHRLWALPMLAAILLAGAFPAGATCAHQYNAALVRQATENQPGVRSFICVLCGDTYTEEIPVTGHIWGPWQTLRAPTATTQGVEIRYCLRNPEHTQQRQLPIAAAPTATPSTPATADTETPELTVTVERVSGDADPTTGSAAGEAGTGGFGNPENGNAAFAAGAEDENEEPADVADMQTDDIPLWTRLWRRHPLVCWLLGCLAGGVLLRGLLLLLLNRRKNR